MAAVSVIIPAYKAEAFIAYTVKSVLEQTMQDFEIIVSADDKQNYESILRSNGIIDPRLKFVSTGRIGAGIGVNRNIAMKAATSNLIAPLDHDDEFMPNHLECLLPKAQQYGAAITQVEFVDQETGALLLNRGKRIEEGLISLENAFLACVHTWTPIIFDRTKIKHFWNEDGILYEDPIFIAGCFEYIKMIWYSPVPSYRYFRRNGSVCNSSNAAQRFLDDGEVILELIKRKKICSSNVNVAATLAAFIRRGNMLESAFIKALAAGNVKDYHEFLGQNLALIHAPLLIE